MTSTRSDRTAFSFFVLAIALASCGREPAPRRAPNVVIWLVDTLRADHLSCYGYARKTSPTIDALAQDGVRFANLHAHANWTQPSIATLLSGCYATTQFSPGFGDRVPERMTLAAEWFSAHGYATIGRTLTVATAAEFGFAQGYDEYLELDRDLTMDARKRRADDVYLAERIVDSAIAWLDAPAATQRPFFLMLHTIDPHEPYTRHPGAAAYAALATTDMDGSLAPLQARKRGSGVFTREEQKLLIDLYDEEIAYNDQQLARLVEHLRARGMFDDTLLVIVADHGEELFDHVSIGHSGRNLHHELTHIPLVMHWPNGLDRGRVVEPLTREVDVLPTLLELIGMDAIPDTDGESVAWLVRGEAASKPYRPVVVAELGKELGDVIAARTEKFLYVVDQTRPLHDPTNFSGFWDLAADALEYHDISKQRSAEAVPLAKYLVQWQRYRMKRGKSYVQEHPQPLDAETRERLQQLGYLAADPDASGK